MCGCTNIAKIAAMEEIDEDTDLQTSKPQSGKLSELSEGKRSPGRIKVMNEHKNDSVDSFELDIKSGHHIDEYDSDL